MSATPEFSSRKVSKKSKSSSKQPLISKKKQSVVFVNQLPREFGEKELFAFFGQFGKVLKLRLSRSPKTARSRRYAYIQYEMPEIATIAVEATNNHFIGGKPIRTEVMSPESVHLGLFKGASRVDPTERLTAKVRRSHNSKIHALTHENCVAKDAERTAKLAAMGVEYEFERRTVERKLRKKPE